MTYLHTYEGSFCELGLPLHNHESTADISPRRSKTTQPRSSEKDLPTSHKGDVTIDEGSVTFDHFVGIIGYIPAQKNKGIHA